MLSRDTGLRVKGTDGSGHFLGRGVQVQACLDEYNRRLAGRMDCLANAVPRIVLVAARAVHTQLLEWEARERAIGAGPNVAVLKVSTKSGHPWRSSCLSPC